MGVSRSTVREALAILVAEGLAIREPNRGVHVTALDPEAVHDVCTARAVLEVAGVRRWASAGGGAPGAGRPAPRDLAAAAPAPASPPQPTAPPPPPHPLLLRLTPAS